MTATKIRWMRSAFACLWAVLVCGCTDTGALTDDERAALATMVLDDETPIPVSATNNFADDPMAAELGHVVFFDKRFNPTGPGNCRTCHDLTYGGADTKTRGATTVFGTATLARNTPTVFNVAFLPSINHWNGQFTAIWSVPSDVGTSTLQMAHFMYDDPYYRPLYESVFGAMPDLSDFVRFPATGNYRSMAWQMMTPDDQKLMGRFATNVGKALEAYQRKLIDKNSAFDRYMNGDETALSPEALRGAKLFVGRAGCNECHNGPTFSDFKFHNIGVPQGTLARDYGFVSAGAFVATYPFNAHSEYSDNPEYGLSLIANMPTVTSAELPMICAPENPMPGCGAFKTARLRSVALTAPYMHTGGFASLWDVVEFYNEAAGSDGYVGRRSPAIAPLYLSDDDIADLVAFLTALSGEPIADPWTKCPTTIPADACTAP
jgi:cytochrome c peroxidase